MGQSPTIDLYPSQLRRQPLRAHQWRGLLTIAKPSLLGHFQLSTRHQTLFRPNHFRYHQLLTFQRSPPSEWHELIVCGTFLSCLIISTVVLTCAHCESWFGLWETRQKSTQKKRVRGKLERCYVASISSSGSTVWSRSSSSWWWWCVCVCVGGGGERERERRHNIVNCQCDINPEWYAAQRWSAHTQT